MSKEQINRNYSYAKEVYASYGVDTDAALEAFDAIPISLHCWQGDDIKGLEGLGVVESQ